MRGVCALNFEAMSLLNDPAGVADLKDRPDQMSFKHV